MDTPPSMTHSEAEALLGVMSNNFGPCVCMSYERMAGHRVWIERCSGHEFLAEDHRIARLLWIRRTRGKWVADEHGHSWHIEQELRQILGADVDG